VEQIATAFQMGIYTYTSEDGSETVSFGTGKNGDLSATIAAVLLDREARTVMLDGDPAQGSVKEILMKVQLFSHVFAICKLGLM
jgi:hypothetical protein